MRADLGPGQLPHGGFIPCPQCPRGWSTEQGLAGHLMDAHGLEAPAAVERARATANDAAKVARREAKGTRAPATMCPRCHRPQPGLGELAVHLTKVHDVDPMAAVAEARGVSTPGPQQDEEDPAMARPCGNCGVVGHGRKTCPKAVTGGGRLEEAEARHAEGAGDGDAARRAAIHARRGHPERGRSRRHDPDGARAARGRAHERPGAQAGPGSRLRGSDDAMTTETAYQLVPPAVSITPTEREAVGPRFWAKVERSDDPDGCWLWTGSTTQGGYGQFYLQGRLIQAHRVAWLLAEGEIPAGQCVCHRCDVRRCVRHAHHFLGTKLVNAQDMASKGRAHLQRNPMGLSGERHWSRRHPGRFAGARNPSAKLTAEQVVKIRERFASGATYGSIATAFGVGSGAVGFIVKGQHWPDAGGPITTARRPPGPRRNA